MWPLSSAPPSVLMRANQGKEKGRERLVLQVKSCSAASHFPSSCGQMNAAPQLMGHVLQSASDIKHLPTEDAKTQMLTRMFQP